MSPTKVSLRASYPQQAWLRSGWFSACYRLGLHVPSARRPITIPSGAILNTWCSVPSSLRGEYARVICKTARWFSHGKSTAFLLGDVPKVEQSLEQLSRIGPRGDSIRPAEHCLFRAHTRFDAELSFEEGKLPRSYPSGLFPPAFLFQLESLVRCVFDWTLTFTILTEKEDSLTLANEVASAGRFLDELWVNRG